jgi:hypothetical protein
MSVPTQGFDVSLDDGLVPHRGSFAIAGILVGINLTAMFVGAGALLLITATLGAASRTMREVD